MAIRVYDPFEKAHFNPQTCFLTGQTLHTSEEQTSIFPDWVLERYSLGDKTFKMLEEGSIVRYKDLKIPCAKEVIEKVLNPLEEEIEKAFAGGYEEVIKVPEERLFQWMAKLVYGILYEDLNIAKRKLEERRESFSLSKFLQGRFKKLHFMLQSLVVPMEFTGIKPWTIRVVKVKYSKDVFNYKDETNNLNFSLGMNDFGIVACLQDNGMVGKSQEAIIKKIGNKTLHPIQFEELCSRFIYTNYLLNSYAEYTVQANDEKILIESVPLVAKANKPLSEPWDDTMFAQVLASYWRPWGLTMSQIITFPNPPISYLEDDYSHELIAMDSIPLPY